MNEVCLRPYVRTKRIAMFVRSPRDHVLSQFVHCFHSRSRKHSATVFLKDDMIQDMTSGFLRWLDHFATIKGQSGCVNTLHSDCNPWNFSECDEQYKECRIHHDFNCYNPNNMQARYITCDRAQPYAGHYIGNETATPDLRQALKTLQLVKFVGITELYSASVCFFIAKMTGTIEEYCRCDHSRRSFHHTDMHAPVHSVETFSSDVLQKVDALTEIDRQIYETALLRFLDEIREFEQAKNSTLLCADDMERLRKIITYLV